MQSAAALGPNQAQGKDFRDDPAPAAACPVTQVGQATLYTGTANPTLAIDDAGKAKAHTAAEITHAFAKAVTLQPSTEIFRPAKAGFSKNLSAIENFYLAAFTKGSLYFRGKVDLDKFVKAMQGTLDAFDFLYCKAHVIDSKVSINYSKEQDSVALEIQTKPGSMQSARAESTLPDNIDPRAKGLAEQLEGLPMARFKLTQFEDGFVIGYYLNHAFMDQSSTVYFFKYLSQKYNGKPDLKEPRLVDLEALATQAAKPIDAKTVDEFRQAGLEVGFTHIPDKGALLRPQNHVDRRVVIDLRFSEEELEGIRKKSPSYISPNDLIHAILLKIYAKASTFQPADAHTFGFACNMRKRASLGDESVGNVITGCLTSKLGTEALRIASVFDLAQKSRSWLATVSHEGYLHRLSWFLNFSKFGDKPTDFLPTFFLKPFQLQVSNWATFSYDEITFGNQAPVKITSPALPRMNLSVITFDSLSGKKFYTTSLAVPTDNLGYVNQLSVTTGLFTYDIDRTS